MLFGIMYAGRECSFVNNNWEQVFQCTMFQHFSYVLRKSYVAYLFLVNTIGIVKKSRMGSVFNGVKDILY